MHLLAILFIVLALIVAVEKFPIEQLHSDDGKYKLEQQIHDQYVDNIFEWADHAVEYSLKFRDSFDCFKWPQDAQNS